MRLLMITTTLLFGFLTGQAYAATAAKEKVIRDFGTLLYCSGPMVISYALAMKVSLSDGTAIAIMEHVGGVSCKRFSRQQVTFHEAFAHGNGNLQRVIFYEFYLRDDRSRWLRWRYEDK